MSSGCRRRLVPPALGSAAGAVVLLALGATNDALPTAALFFSAGVLLLTAALVTFPLLRKLSGG